MAFTFTPKTEEQINADRPSLTPWPKGEYDFDVVSAEEATSKAGNPMIKVRLNVYNNEGERRVIFDYLMESVAYKLKHFVETCGFDYDAGEFDVDALPGKNGRVVLGIKKAQGDYPEGNQVTDYVVSVKAVDVDLNDEVPF